RNGRAGYERCDSADLPVVEHPVDGFQIQPLADLREIVHVVRHEDVAAVEDERAVVPLARGEVRTHGTVVLVGNAKQLGPGVRNAELKSARDTAVDRHL